MPVWPSVTLSRWTPAHSCLTFTISGPAYPQIPITAVTQRRFSRHDQIQTSTVKSQPFFILSPSHAGIPTVLLCSEADSRRLPRWSFWPRLNLCRLTPLYRASGPPYSGPSWPPLSVRPDRRISSVRTSVFRQSVPPPSVTAVPTGCYLTGGTPAIHPRQRHHRIMSGINCVHWISVKSAAPKKAL